MQIDTPPLITKTPKQSLASFYTGAICFVGIMALAVVFFLINTAQSNAITKTREQVNQLDQRIQELSADRQVVVMKILQTEAIRPSLDLKTIVNNFRSVAQKSNVRLQGFSVQDDVISTTLISTHGDVTKHSDPAATIVKMMRDYATEQGTFSLEPIFAISGDSKMRTTGIQLKIVPQILK